jgi:DNA-binding XRE family transcriptional regulator
MKTALYYIRTRCNYSQGMVARELEVSRQMLSAWENGTKTIPKVRKAELAMLFGVPVGILEEQDGSTIRSYCDRPLFCCLCQGRQVFSFQPKNDHSRVCLETPQESRPEERCRELMDRKNAVLELIDQTLRFDPEHQAEQLPEMESSVSLLEEFGKLLTCCSDMEPEHRGRLLRFILEQEEILTAVLGKDTKEHRDEWQKQQIHLLRCRWAKTNRVAKRRRIGIKKTDPTSVWEQIDQWYQWAKMAGWDRAELQWRLNQILEQEHEHELD